MIDQMLDRIECTHTIDHLGQKVLVLSRILEGLSAFGYKDHPKPKSKKNFEFGRLDVKSIR